MTDNGARRRARGFTLLEAALATIIVGVGVLAMMQLLATCTYQNRNAANMTTAMLLASNIQETMAGLPFYDPAYGKTNFGPETGETLGTYDDVDDFGGTSSGGLAFNPPIDSSRASLTDLAQYEQVVTVVPVYSNQLSSNTNAASPEISRSTYTGAVRVLVRILYRVQPTSAWGEVYRTSWIRVNR